MANTLVNQAMDAGKSEQLFKKDAAVEGLPWSRVAVYRQGDVNHWADHELDMCSTNRQLTHGGSSDHGHLPVLAG